MARVKPSNKDQYLNWLSERMESTKLNDIYEAYEKIDTYCLKKNIIQDPLLWHTDEKAVRRVKNIIERSRVFNFYHRGSIEVSKEAINLFYLYIQKNKSGSKNQSKKLNSGYLKENSGVEDSSKKDYYEVDFDEIGDYSYSKPYSYSYFGKTYDNFTSWKGMYVNFVNVLMEDYDYIIEDFKNKSLNNKNGRVDIVNKNDKDILVSPKEIANGLCIETNLSSIDIVKKIKSLLEICLVDNENVRIVYSISKQLEQTDSKEDNTKLNNINISEIKNKKELFYRWLKDEKGLAERTCKNYSSGINAIDDFANNKRLYKKSIYNLSDYREIKQKRTILLKDKEFKKINREQHNRLTASLNNYIEFVKYNLHIETDGEKEEIDKDKMGKYRKILIDKFPRNFRYDSGIELKKFKVFWAKEFFEELMDSDLEIENYISKITILYIEKDRKFALIPETILSEKNKQDLLTYINSLFKSGKNAIYYSALYEEILDILYGSKINNADMLKEYLKYVYKEDMIFKNSYFSLENIEMDPMLEIKGYLISKAKPVEQEIICNDLLHIPRKRVISILHSNKEFIRNSPGVYFHPDSIIIVDSELSEISGSIRYKIDHSGFLTETELIKFVKDKFPGIIERYYQLTDLGLRDVIGYKLQDQYSFNSKIISDKGKDLSVSDVFGIFCNKNEKITLTELKTLKKELNSVIYFDVIYNKKLRVNEEEFVSKKLANFNIDKIDNVIDGFCHGEYVAIQDIRYFSSFPECIFKWNSYLLEHYVAEYSKKYKLVHINFNENSCVGGIVKVSSKIETFYDLVVRVLLDSNIILDTSTALDYLYEKGYLGRRSYRNIDKALIQVKAMKEKKG